MKENMNEKAEAEVHINVASWFMMDKKQKEESDILFKEEDDWIAYIKENEYDIIIADPLLKKAVPFYKGEWYDLPHFAISGKKRQNIWESALEYLELCRELDFAQR